MGCANSNLLKQSSIVSKMRTKEHTQPSASNNIVSDKEKMLMKKSWKLMSNDMIGRGTKVFLYIFSLQPHLKQLFPFRDLEGDALLEDIHFKGHASRFMQAVGAVIDNIDDLEATLVPLLLKLGRQHTQFKGFKPEYFEAFTEAMLHTWTEELNVDFTEDVSKTWRKIFEFIISKLQEGYNQGED